MSSDDDELKFVPHYQEFYDMVRATMLKYYYQVRIGQMDGIFVCYHNTAGTVKPALHLHL